jgi:hypothetical protein
MKIRGYPPLKAGECIFRASESLKYQNFPPRRKPWLRLTVILILPFSDWAQKNPVSAPEVNWITHTENYKTIDNLCQNFAVTFCTLLC